MRKIKEKKVIKKNIQLIILAVIVFALLLITLIRMNHVEAYDGLINKKIFVYYLYGVTILGSIVYSYFSGSRSFRIQASLGVTRKEIYKEYVYKKLEVFLWLIVIILYYVLVDKLLLLQKINIFEVVLKEEIFLLSVVFFLLGEISFLLGVKKVKTPLFILVISFFISCTILALLFNFIYLLLILFFTLMVICAIINKDEFMKAWI